MVDPAIPNWLEMASLLVLLFPHWCMMPSHRVFSCCLVLHGYIAHLVCSYILHSCFPTLLPPLSPLCSFINPGFVMILDTFLIFPTSEKRGNPHFTKGNRYGSLPAQSLDENPYFTILGAYEDFPDFSAKFTHLSSFF